MTLSLRTGLLLLAAGLAAAIVGGLTLVGNHAAQQLGAEGRERIPGTVTFDADDRDYEVLVSPRAFNGDLTPERLTRYVRCEVAQPDETRTRFSGARQAVASVSDFGATVGRFTGQRGRTSVACAWTLERIGRQVSNRFIVAARRSGLRVAAYVVFGLAALLVAAGLFVTVRAARRPVSGL